MENNNLMIFNNEEFGQVRTVYIEDKIFFIAKDIATALGYKDTTNAIKRHCRWVAKHNLPHPQSKTKTIEVNIITEGDIYRLISNSELPSAEKFESWVFDEVLPSIRKHGVYMTDDTLDKMISNPDFGIKLLTELKTEKEKRIEAENKLIEQQPKVELYDAVMNDNGLMNFIQVADVFGECGRNKLMKTLREEKILMDSEHTRNIPYSQYLGNNGYFEVVIRPRKTNDGMKKIATTLCKPKALNLIKKVLDKKKEKLA